MNKVIVRLVIAILSLISVFALSSCNDDDQTISKTDDVESASYSKTEIDENMKIKLEFDGNEIIYELNDSSAAKALYAQLPLTVNIQDYSSNEKIFYPPEELDVSNSPLAEAKKGTLAYYAPWGDVVLFYDNFGTASGLYELGQIASGDEFISSIHDEVKITKVM